MARVANEIGGVEGMTVDSLYSLLRACEGLRDHLRKVIIANLKSSGSGQANAEDLAPTFCDLAVAEMLILSGIDCRRHVRITGIDMAKKRSKKMEVEVGSGNVFADRGFPDAAELDIKVRLTVEIVRLINARRLSQVAAASLLKINQPKISALKNYKRPRGESLSKLIPILSDANAGAIGEPKGQQPLCDS